MKNVAIVSLCLCLLCACQKIEPDPKEQPSGLVDLTKIYRPLPVAISDVDKVIVEDNKETSMSDIVKDQVRVKALLCNVISSTSISKYDNNGNIQYAVGKISGSKGNYRIVDDWMLYAPQADKDSYYYIGCGIRITAEISTNSANLDFSSLSSLGINAKHQAISGSLIVETIGIDSDDVRTLIPFSSTLDENGVAKVMELMTSIKSKITGSAAKSVTFHPKKFAEKPINDTEKMNTQKSLNKFNFL